MLVPLFPPLFVFVVVVELVGSAAAASLHWSFDGGGGMANVLIAGGGRTKRSVRMDKSIEDYLTQFGYLPQSDLETGALRTLRQLQDAVRNLQGFAGIPMTGQLDQQTKELLVKKRCGVQDVATGFRNRRKRYSLQGQRWSHTNLTWSLRRSPQGHAHHHHHRLTRELVRRELSHALQVWAAHTQLSFTELVDSDRADIQVFFHSNYHGDGYPFDGPGSVLAHAFFPGAGRGGDAHFDEDEQWSDRREFSKEATSLFAVAVHEFGHSLGLSHSSVSDSLMFPWYSNVPRDFSLPEDDRVAVQHLYGSPQDGEKEEEDGFFPAYPPPPPKETLPNVGAPTNSGGTTTSAGAAAIVPQKCHTNFDAVAVIRSEMWAFKGKYFWRISKEGGGTRDDPVELSSFWYGLPADIEHVDAVYERGNHDIVFFVGRKYYVMSGNSQLKHGPLPLTNLGLPDTLEKIDGALVWSWNGKTYLFSGTMYWRFDEEAEYIELDYPRDMSMWKGVPNAIDAAFQYTDRKTYFFKDRFFWEFDDSRMEVKRREPTPVGEYWLRCPKEMSAGAAPASPAAASSHFSSSASFRLFLLVLIASYTHLQSGLHGSP